MQEQEQGLEKKERTIYLSSTGDFVNTDLTNPREINTPLKYSFIIKAEISFTALNL